MSMVESLDRQIKMLKDLKIEVCDRINKRIGVLVKARAKALEVEISES